MCDYESKNYKSDTGRIINKFDIYYCDLGEPEAVSGGNIGKTRPCVIVSSNDINDPMSNMYLISPIRTEHMEEVTKESIDQIIKAKREIGRIYVPIEMKPDDIRFIDMKQTQPVAVSKVYNYIASIINPKVQEKINEGLLQIYFSENELKTMFPIKEEKKSSKTSSKKSEKVKEEKNDNETKVIELYDKVKNGMMTEMEASKTLGMSTETFKEVANSYEELSEISKPKTNKKSNFKKPPIPNGFSMYYRAYKEKKMTVIQIASKLGVTYQTVYNYIKKYEALHNELPAVSK